MNNFRFYNPVDLHFGTGVIDQISALIDARERVLFLYGGGSIRRNGVYNLVVSQLKSCGAEWQEFSGIEPNPLCETARSAIEKARSFGATLILAVGGGSVVDAAKFIAAGAVLADGVDAEQILRREVRIDSALPIGVVLTLPATGSEMNGNSVISVKATDEKLAFYSPHLLPRFALLDPETTYSLPPRQVRNGIVDAWVHVLEQYLTFRVGGLLQERQSEAVLATLLEIAQTTLAEPENYTARANLMWAATQALNGQLSLGVPTDWATHMIGHELTALHGIDHAQSLAVVWPGLARYRIEAKRELLSQYGQRIFAIENCSAEQAIDATIDFFESIGQPTKLSAYGIVEESFHEIARRFKSRSANFGEHKDINAESIAGIYRLCLE